MHETLYNDAAVAAEPLGSLREAAPANTPNPTGSAAFDPGQGSWMDARRPRPSAALRLPADCTNAVLDKLDTGVVLCDASCRALLLNEAALNILEGCGALRLQLGDRVVAACAVDQPRLALAVHQAAFHRLHQLVPLRTGVQTLMVAVQPLVTTTPSQPIAMLLLGRRQLAPTLAVEMLANLYTLTPAECRILKGLLDGRRVAALASEHQVAVSTVRTQVASLRAKIGVARVEDLLRLVAELPPMSSALRARRHAANDQCGIAGGHRNE